MMEPQASMIHWMSGIRERVAMMSSQKKKLYLKSSFTMVLMKISTEKSTKDTRRNEKKYGSASLVVSHTLKSSYTFRLGVTYTK